MDERITITIRRDLLERVDKLVDKKKVRSRSHAFEIIMTEYFDKFRIKNAVIQCGGEKPNFDRLVHGKIILNHIIGFLKREGIENIYVTVSRDNKKKVKDLVKEDKIKIIEESEPLGTGGALKSLRNKLRGTFFVVNGDVYFDLNLNDFLLFHRMNGGLMTLCLTSVKEPLDYGVAKMRGSKIVEFVEKPKMASSYLVNAGIFLAEPEMFNFMSTKEKISLEYDVLPNIVKSERLFGYLLSGRWMDVGKS